MLTSSIEGKTCHYQDIGTGPTILFGHSYLWTSDMFRPQIEKLSKEYRCISVDLWDHGLSGPINKQGTSIEALADDYWKLMQSLGLSEFALVGLSVGGMWGAQLALNHPEAVTALALMDTFVGSEPMMTKLKYFALLGIIEKQEGFSEPILDQIVPLFFSPHTLKNNQTIVSDFRKSLANLKKEQIPGIVTLGRAIFSRRSLLKELPKLEMPSLVLTGKDDIPRPPSEAKQMAELLPNSALYIIENAGHISNLEQPDDVTSILENFINEAVAVRRKIAS